MWLHVAVDGLLTIFTAAVGIYVRAVFETAQSSDQAGGGTTLALMTVILAALPILFGVLAALAIWRLRRLSQDLAGRTVEVVEGAIGKSWSSVGGGRGTSYSLTIDRSVLSGDSPQAFETWREIYGAAPERSGRCSTL